MFGKRGASEELARAAPPRGPAAAAVPAQKPAPPAPKAAAPKPAASAPATPPAQPAAAAPAGNRANVAPTPSVPATIAVDNRSDDYYQVKTTIFSALIDTIDLAQLAQLDVDSAREEIRDIVNEIITIKSVVMSIAEHGPPVSGLGSVGFATLGLLEPP